MTLAPLFFLASALLALAGIVKVCRSDATARALYAAGLPGGPAAVRALGIAEVAAGVAALLRSGVGTALVVAGLYLAFAAFVAYLKLARPAAASCGCAGAHDVPPSWTHVIANLVAAAAAAAAAIVGVPSLGAAADALGWAAVPAALGLAMAGWLAVVAVGEVPAALGAWTAPTHHEEELFDPDRHRRADAALAMAGIGPEHPSLWPDTDVPHPGAPPG